MLSCRKCASIRAEARAIIAVVRRREFREMMDKIGEEHRLQREALARWAEEGRQRDEEGRQRDEEGRQRDEEGRRRDVELGRSAEQQRIELRALREDQKRRFDAIDVAIENDRRVTREMLLELREGRAMLRDMRRGIQANTEGLLRVLDEFRRDDGPAAAGA
jgi:hypothetical protein